LQMPSTARFCSSSPPPGSFIDIIDKKFRGKLIIIPTPIGNMQDISVNIYKKLFEVDVIGCEDTRVAGKLFKLIETREIANKLYNLFGFSNKEMVEYDPI
jgi:16S rRNA C1402 (ribose-2'-O) methylase RsmI